MGTTEALLTDIEAYLVRTGMNATQFGLQALNDPRFVFDLRAGERSPQAKTIDRVRDFMSGATAKAVA